MTVAVSGFQPVELLPTDLARGLRLTGCSGSATGAGGPCSTAAVIRTPPRPDWFETITASGPNSLRSWLIASPMVGA